VYAIAGPWQRGTSYGIRTVPTPGASTLLPGAMLPPTPYGRCRDPLRKKSEKEALRRLPSKAGGLDDEQDALDAAIKAEKDSLAGASELSDALRAQARCHAKIGNIHFAKGDFALAVEAYQRRVHVAEKLKDEVGLARGLGNVANALSRINLDKALEVYRECLTRATAVQDLQTQYKALAGMLAAYRKGGDYLKVQEFDEKIMHLRRAMTQAAAARPGTAPDHLSDPLVAECERPTATPTGRQMETPNAPDDKTPHQQHSSGLGRPETASPLDSQSLAARVAWAGGDEDEAEAAGRGVDEEEPETEEEKTARRVQLAVEHRNLTAAQLAYQDQAADLRAKIQSRTQKRPLYVTPVVALPKGLSCAFVRHTGAPPVPPPARLLGVGRKSAISPPYKGEKPHLELEHVYGAAMADSHGGLLSPRSAMGKTLVYAASGVCVVHEIDKNEQALFSANDAARVMCLALHPDDKTVASCHMSGTSASLNFWAWSSVGVDGKQNTAPSLDIAALATANSVPPIRDVRAAAFSKYGDVLLLLLEHTDGSFSLMAVEWRKPLWLAFVGCRALLHTQPTALACCAQGRGALAVVGKGRISLVAMAGDGQLGEERCAQGPLASDAFLCAAFLGERVLAAGCAGGALWLTDSATLSVLVKLRVHAGPLWDMSVDSVRAVTVGGDGFVREWMLDEDDILAAGFKAPGCAAANNPRRGAAAAAAAAVREEDAAEGWGQLLVLLQAVDVGYHFLYGLAVLQAREVSFGALPLRQWKPGEPGTPGGGGVDLRAVCLLPAKEWGPGGGGGGGKVDRGGIAVVTASNEMVVVSGTIPPTVTLVQTAHASGAAAGARGISGLSSHPSLPEFATAGVSPPVFLPLLPAPSPHPNAHMYRVPLDIQTAYSYSRHL